MKLNATSEPPQKEGLSPLALSKEGEGRGGGGEGRVNETKQPKVIS